VIEALVCQASKNHLGAQCWRRRWGSSSHSGSLDYLVEQGWGLYCDRRAVRCDNIESYHQLDSHCAVPDSAGIAGELAVVPESSADLAERCVVPVLTELAGEVLQSDVMKSSCGLAMVRQSVVKKRSCGLEEVLQSGAYQRPWVLVEVL
jgi:hypothetical protein